MDATAWRWESISRWFFFFSSECRSTPRSFSQKTSSNLPPKNGRRHSRRPRVGSRRAGRQRGPAQRGGERGRRQPSPRARGAGRTCGGENNHKRASTPRSACANAHTALFVDWHGGLGERKQRKKGGAGPRRKAPTMQKPVPFFFPQPQDAALVDALLQLNQAHVFESWPPLGEFCEVDRRVD